MADIIKNKHELSGTRERAMTLEIVEAGIRSVLPENVMISSLTYDSAEDVLVVKQHRFELSGRRLFVVGGGKAAAEMARLLERIVGPQRITSGIVATKLGDPTAGTKKVEVVTAGHPVPDQRGVVAVNKMLALKQTFAIGSSDVVLCLLSGGGSALLPCPADGITLEDKQRVTALLLSSGANIADVNAVRKHLSRTKGGQLGRFFAPATVVSVILSDVIGNDLSVIASGPTYPDVSTFSEALQVLHQYGIAELAPPAVVHHLEHGVAGLLPETPKQLTNCQNIVIADIAVALSGMVGRASEFRLKPFVVTREQKGEPGEAAALRAREIIKGKYRGFDILLLGGETTPRLPLDHGSGGRNQHYAAVSLLEMSSYQRPWTMASVGTDGSDFLPEVAGAIVDQSTLSSFSRKGVDVSDYVGQYDSYGLFRQATDCLVRTGNTGTNVGDVVAYLLK